MKKHNTLTDGEQLLARVLEECLEEDLSFVPPEREIARKHRFSQEFEDAMSELLEDEEEEDEEEEAIRRHFRPRFGELAAVILVFFVCGAVALSLTGSFFPASTSSDMAVAETTEETGEAASAETWDMEEAAEETSGTDTGEESGEATAAGSMAEYDGELIDEAAEQELASSQDGLTLELAYPGAEGGNTTVDYSLENSGEEAVSYSSLFDLEVYLDGLWYTVPYAGEEARDWASMESGMVLDGALDLSAWAIDGEAHQYRLVLQLADGRIGVEFSFEEAALE